MAAQTTTDVSMKAPPRAPTAAERRAAVDSPLARRVLHDDAPKIPRPALFGAAALMLGALALSIYGASQPRPPAAPTAAEIAALRTIEIRIAADGALTVWDAGADGPFFAAAPEDAGFIAGVARGVSQLRAQAGASERLRSGVERRLGPLQVFAGVDGRIALYDPVADARVDLGGFGSDNRAAFAALLAAPAAPAAN